MYFFSVSTKYGRLRGELYEKSFTDQIFRETMGTHRYKARVYPTSLKNAADVGSANV